MQEDWLLPWGYYTRVATCTFWLSSSCFSPSPLGQQLHEWRSHLGYGSSSYFRPVLLSHSQPWKLLWARFQTRWTGKNCPHCALSQSLTHSFHGHDKMAAVSSHYAQRMVCYFSERYWNRMDTIQHSLLYKVGDVNMSIPFFFSSKFNRMLEKRDMSEGFVVWWVLS